MKIQSAKIQNKQGRVLHTTDLWSISLKDAVDVTACTGAGRDGIGLWKRFSEGYWIDKDYIWFGKAWSCKGLDAWVCFRSTTIFAMLHLSLSICFLTLLDKDSPLV